jgi:hypothetical protein
MNGRRSMSEDMRTRRTGGMASKNIPGVYVYDVVKDGFDGGSRGWPLFREAGVYEQFNKTLPTSTQGALRDMKCSKGVL